MIIISLILLITLLVFTAYLDATSYEVPLWLIAFDVLALAFNHGPLTEILMGLIIGLVLMVKRKKLKIGGADIILLPFLIVAFSLWPILGFAVGQWIARKKGWKHYPLLPWLIGASLIGKVVMIL